MNVFLLISINCLHVLVNIFWFDSDFLNVTTVQPELHSWLVRRTYKYSKGAMRRSRVRSSPWAFFWQTEVPEYFFVYFLCRFIIARRKSDANMHVFLYFIDIERINIRNKLFNIKNLTNNEVRMWLINIFNILIIEYRFRQWAKAR